MPRRLTAVAVAVASVLALGDSAEAATPPTPVTLSAPGANAASPVTAVGPSGDVAVAWRRKDAAGDWRVQLRVRDAGGDLGPIQTLSRAANDAAAPDVAVDADGTVVAVWSQHDEATGSYTVLGRTRSADGTLSTFRYLSAGVGDGPGTRDPRPQVALGPDGAAVVVWQAPFGATYRAVARTIGADGSVASAWQALSRTGLVARPISLDVAADGDAVVAWTRHDGTSTRVEARTRATDGTLAALRVLSPAGQQVADPVVAVEPDGDAVVGWVREGDAGTSLHARRLAASGAVSGAQRISLNSHDVDDDPVTGWGELGVSDTGDVVFVWQQDKFCCGTEVVVRGLSAEGVLSPVAWARTTATARQPQVVVAPGGGAVLSFTQLDETFWDRIVVRTYGTDGLLGPAQVVSAFGRDARFSDLAMNETGQTAVAWVRADSSDPACCDRTQLLVGP